MLAALRNATHSQMKERQRGLRRIQSFTFMHETITTHPDFLNFAHWADNRNITPEQIRKKNLRKYPIVETTSMDSAIDLLMPAYTGDLTASHRHCQRKFVRKTDASVFRNTAENRQG